MTLSMNAANQSSPSSAHGAGADENFNDLKITFGQSEAFLLKIAPQKAGRCNERQA
jgi:hypothetical protein